MSTYQWVVNMLQLSEGKKYNVTFNWGTYKGIYYNGYCNSLNGQECYCCNHPKNAGHLFKVPSNDNTTYEECEEGQFKEQVVIGNICIKKLEITECFE